MVEINETADGFQVSTVNYRETFVSKFKAIMAAHAVAMMHAAELRQSVSVTVPTGWGEAIVIEPN